MSNTHQRSTTSEADDEESAFHSADEGEEEPFDDQNHPVETFDQPDTSVATIKDTSTTAVSSKPTAEPSIAQREKPVATSPVPESKPTTEPSIAQREEPAATSPVPEGRQVQRPAADGWDFDDWDAAAAADEEASERGDGRDTDETMMTPPSEKPPPLNPALVQKADDIAIAGPDQAGTAQKPSSLWGGWGHQLFSLATDSISNLTNSVGEGLTSVLETMETTVGAPTPEELAKLSTQERDQLRKKADEVKEPAPVGERDDCDSASEEISSEGGSDTGTARSEKEDVLSSGYQSDTLTSQVLMNQRLDQQRGKNEHGFTTLFSGMSNLLENTGKTLVSGSLDVLESLGRKTFETVTVSESLGEGQRRRFKIPIPTNPDRSGKPNLSQILRELKEKAENEAKQKEQEQEARRCNYAALFEDAQGLVCLEALELLSTNCSQQTRSLMELLTSDQQEEVASSMESVKSLFDEVSSRDIADEEPTVQNFAFSMKKHLKLTPTVPNRLLALDDEARSWIGRVIEQQDKGTRVDANEINEKCMQTLATFTAASVDMYHKLGQMMLVPNSIPTKSANIQDDQYVRSLTNVTTTLREELSFLSSRFTAALNTASDDSEDPDGVSRMLTNVFYEASNSVGYVQEAAVLMLPIIQLASVRDRFR